METLLRSPLILHRKFRTATKDSLVGNVYERVLSFLQQIRSLGFSSSMEEYEMRKLGVFNLLNFFQMLSGLLVPIIAGMMSETYAYGTWFKICLPALTSGIVLYQNYRQQYHAALMTYFLVYPFLTCIVYINGINPGISLDFILFGVLSVFFVKDIGYMLFMIGLSMVSYFILSVVVKDHVFELRDDYPPVYLINHGISIIFIYYGLYLIKKENQLYQLKILRKNKKLHLQNAVISEKQKLLQHKAAELAELNTLKNKLFSVVSHDLKTPLYALRNLFQNIEKYKIPAEEVKELVPEMAKELDFTIGMMENLLEWSKNQMQSDQVKPEQTDVAAIIDQVIHQLMLQASAKQLRIDKQVTHPVYAFADKHMIHLVLRNLLSNAIKFTPENGQIEIGINETNAFTEIYVHDSGIGISREAIKKIQGNQFYTTKGTASESGTGLGLLLCREFLQKNGGQMHIESEPGKGSIFSFTLPARPDAVEMN